MNHLFSLVWGAEQCNFIYIYLLKARELHYLSKLDGNAFSRTYLSVNLSSELFTHPQLHWHLMVCKSQDV